MQTVEDKVLVDNLTKGDDRAFAELYRKYHSDLYRYAWKFLRCDNDAKEIVHDVYFKIWEKRETLNSDLSIKYFLIKVCKNMVLNQMVKAARLSAYKQEILIASNENLENETEDAVIYADFEKFAHAAIAHLPPQRQAVYKMCKMEEKSYEEAAEAFGISKGTVRDHMLKATRSIKKFLSTT
ncbi:MAG: RNA polymerase sigma-70 factor [Cyclobacteriaceae bacterium]